MTLFELVKQNICVPDAAEHYGLQVNRNGMCSCPFHEDRHPSMKLNERYFYCFGCGATGDVIDLVARLFDLSSYEAAQKLAQDFGIGPDKPPAAAVLPKPERPLLTAYRQEEVRCLRVLCDYLHLLESWKVQYAPKTLEDVLDDRFVEACQMLDYVEYLADLLIAAELEQRIRIVEMLNKDGLIAGLEERLGRLKRRTMPMKNKAQLDGMPVWFDGKSINEALFCEEFLQTHKIIFTNGAFFTPEGRVTDELPLRGEIFEELKCCAVSNIPRKISNIVELMKLAALVEDFPRSQTGFIFPTGRFFWTEPLRRESRKSSATASCGLQPQRPKACSLAAISGWPALPGGHPHLAGIYRLLPDSQQQGTTDDGH